MPAEETQAVALPSPRTVAASVIITPERVHGGREEGGKGTVSREAKGQGNGHDSKGQTE